MKETAGPQNLPAFSSTQIKHRDFLKRFLCFFAPLFAVFAGIIFSLYVFELQSLRKQFKTQEKKILELATETDPADPPPPLLVELSKT